MNNILIVEDETIVALDIRKHLIRFGYNVLALLTSGDDAIVFIKDNLPDLVLMDIKINGSIDGLEAATHIMKNYSIPVILLTAYADDDTINRAKIAQPYGYIIKPFDDRDLKTAIELALTRSLYEKKIRESNSKMKILEEQLRQVQKMEAIGRLAGGIAHDFNNILTVILGYSGLLFDYVKDDKEMIQDIEGIKNASLKAQILTRQLLAFSRNQMLNPKIININEIVTSSEKMYKRLLHENIICSFNLNAKNANVFFDPVQFDQVIMNLIVNARDAIEENGRLLISTENINLHEELLLHFDKIPAGDYIKISVKDNGKGIEEQYVSKIFEPFFTTKDNSKSSGLGLSTAYGIIKQSESYIDVISSLNEGTEFIIYIPIKDSIVEENIQNHFIQKSYHNIANILLVEDELYVKDVIAKVLRRDKFTVLEAANPGEAIIISENTNNEIDLLITDVVMPLMNGFKLAERIKKERPNIKVLYISGYADNELLINKKTIHFLKKPFTSDELINALANIISL